VVDGALRRAMRKAKAAGPMIRMALARGISGMARRSAPSTHLLPLVTQLQLGHAPLGRPLTTPRLAGEAELRRKGRLEHEGTPFLD